MKHLKSYENIDFKEDWEEEEEDSYEGMEFDTYVHGSKEEGYTLSEELGIDKKHPLFTKLRYINYEVKIKYKIINGEPVAISIDNKKINYE